VRPSLYGLGEALCPTRGPCKAICIRTTERRHGLSEGQKIVRDTTWAMYWMGRDFSSIVILLFSDQRLTKQLGNSQGISQTVRGSSMQGSFGTSSEL